MRTLAGEASFGLASRWVAARRGSFRMFLAVLAAVAMSLADATAQDVFIHDARVHTASSRGTIVQGDVLVRDGKIAAVGADLTAPADVSSIDAKGRPLTPGLFAGLTAIGLAEVPAEAPTVDANVSFLPPLWSLQWRPEFDVVLAFNPRSVLVPIAQSEGLTWTMLTPRSASALLAGQGTAVTLDGRYDAAISGSRTLFVQLGGSANGLSGGSRAAQFMLLDQAIREARSPAAAGEGALLQPAGREALARYLAGGRVAFQVDRAADLRQVIAFAQLNGMSPVIVGGAEAWVVAQDLARANVPVLLDPLDNLPATFDQIAARLDNAALLHKAGVKIAFSQRSQESHYAQKIRQLAGTAVAHGLPWDAALAALTATPAEIFGVAATQGSIAPGQVADLVLWDSDPLEVTTIADQVWLGGRNVERRSRQLELRDRYLR